MKKVISVRFKDNGKTYYFDPADTPIKTGDYVIVETARGVECGEVVQGVKEIADSAVPKALKPITRMADSVDVRRMRQNREDEKRAYHTCQECIARHGLEMKLVEAEYTLDRSKIMFYFTADGRVDFRELVKDLAGIFHTRIELRQIGVRDESKMIGGLGICGQPFCWLPERLSARLHQDGKRAGSFPQPDQDQWCLRPPDVLPGLRGERLRVPEQHHAHGGQHRPHTGRPWHCARGQPHLRLSAGALRHRGLRAPVL